MQIGAVIAGRYVAQTLVGQGGTCDVFGVYDTELKVHRVLKVAARPSPQAARRWLEIEHAFLTDARESAFPACFDKLEVDGAAVLVLEYCRGTFLAGAALPRSATGGYPVLG